MPIVTTPPKGMDPYHVMRRKYEEDADSSYGLSEILSCPSTPDSFIVTPEGKTLPAVRNIIGDSEGHLINKFMVDKVWDSDAPFIQEIPISRPYDFPNAIPVQGLQDVHLPISWEEQPKITWKSADTEPVPRRRYVDIYTVDSDGTTYKVCVPERQYQAEHKEPERPFVVDRHGDVRYAHVVMMPTPDGMHVVLRSDDDTGGVFDEVPIPDLVVRPFYDVVYIADPQGKIHAGSSCMVATPEGIVIYARCARWEVGTAPPNTPLLTYNRKLIMPRRRDPCDVVDSFTLEKNGLVTEYKKVLLAYKGKVLISYQTGNNNDLVLCSEDGTVVRLVAGTRQPVATEYHDVVYITSPQGVTFPGINILIATPVGLQAVAAVASFEKDKVLREIVSLGMRGMPGYVDVAGLVGKRTKMVRGLRYPAIEASYKQNRDKLVYDTADKVDRCKHQKVTIASQDEVKYTMLYPRSETEVGAFIAGPQTMIGHSVMYMGSKGCCEVRYVRD